jgi:ribose transport system ATP-binding protein
VAVAISVDRLTKNYGPTRALDGASFEVGKGDVHALLGENGAGKSTIVKVLSGLVRPNNGEVRIDGGILPFGSPRAARALGIATAFQEISQIPDLPVGRNLLLPDEPLRAGLFIDRAASRRRVAEIIEEQELHDIHPDADFRDLDLPLRQKIEIAKAVSRKPAILLLDEPTSALSGKDVDWLERRIEQARANGATIILITHRLPEVRRFCGKLSILRGGQHVGSFATETVSDDEVMSLIVGRSIGSAYPRRAPGGSPFPDAPPLLSVERLAVSPRLEEATFQIQAGEILGVGGLQGMGQLELFHALFGIESPTAGTIGVGGKPVVLASPRDAVRAGVSLVPEERKTEGLALKLSGKHNVSLPVIDRLSRFGWIDSGRERSAVAHILSRVQVHSRALFMPCSAFSGGNQQKIVLAKWLMTNSRVLLLFDPTRGVDVGTKREIFLLMHEFADAGGAILFYSTDTAELAHLCDRVAVIYRGRIAGILDHDEASEDRILRIALGVGSASEKVCEPAE